MLIFVYIFIYLITKFTFMKQKLFALFCTLFLSSFVFAQETSELMITFDKKALPVNAVQIKLSGSAKGAEEIMFEKMRKASTLKPKKEGDVMVVRAAIIPEISQTKMDYSYRVDKAEKGSTLTFYISLGNNNYIRSDKYPQEIESAKKFLLSVEKDLKVYDQEIVVKDQTEAVKKEESKLKDAEKAAADLDKKIKEMQAQLEKAQKSVSEQKGVLDVAKAKLAEFEAALKALKI